MAIIGTTNVGKYPKPHGSQGSGGTTVWRGSIKNTDLPGTMGIGSISAEKGFIGDLTGNTLTYNEGNFTYLFAQDGTVKIIRGDELRYKTGKIDDFAADTISAGKIKDVQELTVEGKAWIDELNSRTITTDYLTVTKQAHFFELIIDKIRSVGGTLILTQANCIADYVKPCDSNGEHMPKILNEDDDYVEDLENPNVRFFDVYWTAEDQETGRVNTNDWIEGDQAYCQSFNNVTEGVNYDVSNKYYWRLVTDVLDDCYMNLRTGAELTLQEAPSATVNKVTINSPRITYHDNLNNEIIVNTGWNTAAQSIIGVQTGVTWTPSSGGASSVTQGTMQTVNTIFGIQLTPIADTKLSNAVPEKFILDTDIVSQGSVTGGPARLNIGIYYQDGTSEYFAAPAKATNHYEYPLKKTLDEEHSTQDNPVYYSATNSPIQVVVITNADEVEWHLVHGIRLSNTDMDIDTTFDPDRDYVSVPSVGDNIAQLGYRASGNNDPNIDRGNAIILAAYKTPDRGTGQVGSYKQYAIKPPSYAQYVAIGSQGPAGPQGHYYDLAYYRHTSMDANGSRFIGNFYTTGGTDIETMIQTGGADLYQLFTAYCRNYNANPHIQYPTTNWDWIKASPNMPGGIAYTYEGHASVPITKQQGETDEQAIARVGASLTFSDYSWIERPGSTGTPGGHWVNAYKNVTSTNTPPSPPNDNGVPKTLAELQNGWNGWYATPQTLSDGYYTWMSQAFVNGNGSYDLWETAVRLTGADGTDGTDGNDIEFIYYRNNGDVDGDPLTPPAPPNGHTYRPDWPATYNGSVKTSDHETITVGGIQYTWYDNPQGVGDYPNDPNAYLYEYMSQRIRRNGAWSDYTEPVVWSNWGLKGQDGDGYEYIFKVINTDNPSWTGQANPANWNSSSAVDERGHYFNDDEYLGPVNQGWKDDPQGVAENLKYEYCSMRKKTDGSWNSFSTPALWAHWSAPGSQGPTGPQGPGGAAGRMYILADAGSQAYYSISLSIQNEIITDWIIQLKYNIYKSEGLSTTAMTQSEIQDAGIRPYALIKKTNASTDSYIWYRFDITTENNIGLCTLTYNRPSSGWTDLDVQKFVTNHQSIRVALLPNNSDHYSENASVLSQKYDENTLPFQLSNNAQWISYAGDLTLPESDPRRYASIKGLVTNTTENANHITSLTLGVQGIQGQVTQLDTDLHGPQGFQSQLDQQADSITLMTSEIRNIEASIDVQKSEMIDLTSQSSTYYYPVSISLQRNRTDYQRIRVSRWLDSDKFGSKPSWATNENGFVLDLDWQTIGSGWGTNWPVDQPEKNPRFIINYNLLYTSSTKVAGNITQNPYNIIDENGNSVTGQSGSYDPNRWCDEIVYLKGGSKYLVETDFSDAIIQAYKTSTGYSWSDGQGTTFSAPRITASSFTVNETDTMSKSEIVQTVNSISLGVVEQNAATKEQLSRTGIDIEHGKINLQGDKVTFCDSNGGHQGNIQIDSTTGTLKAVNGEFSGTFTAEKSNTAKIVIDPSTPTIQGYNYSYSSSNPSFELNTTQYTSGNSSHLTMRGPQTLGVFEGSRLQVSNTSSGQNNYIHLETSGSTYRPMAIFKSDNGNILNVGLKNGKIYIKPSSRSMWPSESEAESGAIYLDQNSYLCVKA